MSARREAGVERKKCATTDYNSQKPTLGTSSSGQHLFAARFSLLIDMPALISSNDFVRPISF